jgi:hypothetical protein
MDFFGRQRGYVFQRKTSSAKGTPIPKALTNVANRILDRRRIGEVVREEEVLELLRCWRQTVRQKDTSGSYLHGEFHETTDRQQKSQRLG